MAFPDPSIPTQSKSVATFNPNVLLAPTSNWSNSKKPAIKSLSSFRVLFQSIKLAKANLSDNKLLLQILEKIKTLSKVSIKQFKLIQHLDEKINNLFKAKINVELDVGPSNQSTMVT